MRQFPYWSESARWYVRGGRPWALSLLAQVPVNRSRSLPALCRVPLIARIRSLGARAAAHEHWLYALCVIAWRLNGREQVKHIGRRRLIARVRSLGAVRKTSIAETFRADGFGVEE